MREFNPQIDLKEQYILLGTAKLAKEKGFQRGSKTVYIDWIDGSNTEWYYDYYTVNNKEGYDLSNESWTVYEAPTQNILKQWLKLKYNLPVVPVFNKTFGWMFKIIKHQVWEYKGPELYFKTEEAAMEAGLIAAMNLINDEYEFNPYYDELNEIEPDDGESME